MKHENHEMHHMKSHQHDEPLEDTEIQDWKRKMVWSWSFAIPIGIIMILQRVFNILIIPEKYLAILFLIVGFPVLFIFGWNTIKGGMRGLFTFYFNMDSLIALGTIVAYLTGFLSFAGIVDDYSGVAAMIMAFFTTGKYVEAVARGRASQEIMKLLELGAKKAIVIRKGKETEIDISEVKIGDIIVVRP